MSAGNSYDSKVREWVKLVAQTALVVCAIGAAISLGKSSAVVGTVCLAASLIIFRVAQLVPRIRARLPGWAANRGFGLLVWLGLFLTAALWDLNLGTAVFVSSVALAGARRWLPVLGKISWNSLAGFWLGFLGLIWLVTGYFANLPGSFFPGLFSILTLFILCRLSFRMNAIGAQAVNTVILLLAGLPVVDLIYRASRDAEIRVETYPNYYSFDKAKGDPKAVGRAVLFFRRELGKMAEQIYEDNPQPGRIAPGLSAHRSILDRPTDQWPGFRLRPGSHGFLGECPVSINSNGFRGREISTNKDVYRIVALGESTTFGITIKPDDKPWPEVLEQIIRERMKTRRPVEVINAGMVAYTLLDNLNRLPQQILPLKPDMIISYHGANGFYLIDSRLMRPVGEPTPDYEERPLKLAADFEYRIKLQLFFNRYKPQFFPDKPALGNPMNSRYAGAYRQLIQIAATNHVHLMLANYCMAVNGKSDPAVITFYQGAESDPLLWRMQANMAHTRIVEELVKEHPEVGFIDTHPGLDGQYQKFIDVLHFTQEGRQQMAENMFAGIKKTLEKDIGR